MIGFQLRLTSHDRIGIAAFLEEGVERCQFIFVAHHCQEIEEVLHRPGHRHRDLAHLMDRTQIELNVLLGVGGEEIQVVQRGLAAAVFFRGDADGRQVGFNAAKMLVDQIRDAAQAVPLITTGALKLKPSQTKTRWKFQRLKRQARLIQLVGGGGQLDEFRKAHLTRRDEVVDLAGVLQRLRIADQQPEGLLHIHPVSPCLRGLVVTAHHRQQFRMLVQLPEKFRSVLEVVVKRLQETDKTAKDLTLRLIQLRAKRLPAVEPPEGHITMTERVSINLLSCFDQLSIFRLLSCLDRLNRLNLSGSWTRNGLSQRVGLNSRFNSR